MEYIGFTTVGLALAHRTTTGCGGWIFASEGGGAVLFRVGLTASQVMLHAAARGSGTLV